MKTTVKYAEADRAMILGAIIAGERPRLDELFEEIREGLRPISRWISDDDPLMKDFGDIVYQSHGEPFDNRFLIKYHAGRFANWPKDNPPAEWQVGWVEPIPLQPSEETHGFYWWQIRGVGMKEPWVSVTYRPIVDGRSMLDDALIWLRDWLLHAPIRRNWHSDGSAFLWLP